MNYRRYLMKKIEDAYNEGFTKATGVLTPILVANLRLAPAIATIIAILIVQKIAIAFPRLVRYSSGDPP